MRSLEGANCADLPPFVTEKYFHCDVRREPLRAMAALAICGNCPVEQECRDEALNMNHLQTRGVIGGVPVIEIRNARRWRSYEEGISDKAPNVHRPDWLTLSEAAEAAEEGRLTDDPDEPAQYVFDSPDDQQPVPFQPRPISPLPNPAPRRRPTPRTAPAQFEADVPMALEGANCAVLPTPLVEEYFNSDVLREPHKATLAKLVCHHCEVLESCVSTALNASNVRESGVIAGQGAREMRRGRAWLRHEAGATSTPPRSTRPGWLPHSEASGVLSPPPDAPTFGAEEAP